MEMRPISAESLDDFGHLLRAQPESSGCWCMWFIARVADYHAAGDAGNRGAFSALVQSSTTPMGLLAYERGEAVGWCAVGPRSRYTRILRAPTLKGRNKAEDDTVWLVPCFLVRENVRRRRVATDLLQAAVDLAARSGATAIEGFPLSGAKTRSRSADFMTGTEALFSSCEFIPVDRPSNNRVIMRRELAQT